MKAKLKKLGYYPISVFRAIKAGNGTDRSFEDIILDKLNINIKAISHRGYTAACPENTLIAFKESKIRGYDYVEADVMFTSDNVPVIIHNTSIDETSDGTGKVAEMTYEELQQYDFGSWYSEKYIGTTIPTFTEFILLCKHIGLRPYIELKGTMTIDNIKLLINIVKRHGMQKYATWISFNGDYLAIVKDNDVTARIGYLTSSDNGLDFAATLLTGQNEVFVDTEYTKVTDEWVDKCINKNLALEVYTVNSKDDIKQLHPYVTGVTSDTCIAGRILCEAVFN